MFRPMYSKYNTITWFFSWNKPLIIYVNHVLGCIVVRCCTPSTRHKKLVNGSCKGVNSNNEVADFPQLISFCKTLPNSLGTVAPDLEGLSVKKQHLLLQQSKRQREQMCPKSNTAYKVCKIGNDKKFSFYVISLFQF